MKGRALVRDGQEASNRSAGRAAGRAERSESFGGYGIATAASRRVGIGRRFAAKSFGPNMAELAWRTGRPSPVTLLDGGDPLGRLSCSGVGRKSGRSDRADDTRVVIGGLFTVSATLCARGTEP